MVDVFFTLTNDADAETTFQNPAAGDKIAKS